MASINATVLPPLILNAGSCYHSGGMICPQWANTAAKVYPHELVFVELGLRRLKPLRCARPSIMFGGSVDVYDVEEKINCRTSYPTIIWCSIQRYMSILALFEKHFPQLLKLIHVHLHIIIIIIIRPTLQLFNPFSRVINVFSYKMFFLIFFS